MSIQQELSKIKEGKLAPIYLVLGREQFLRDTFKWTLEKQVFLEEEDEMNAATFDMKETSLSVALEEASTIPFFGNYRLVTIDNPSFLTGEKKSSTLEHNIPELINYLETPSETTILVISAPYEKLDERKKVVKLLKKKAVLIDVSDMNEREVRTYVLGHIKGEGYDITPEALDRLLVLTDMNLSKVMSELPKLLLYSSDTKKIVKSVVEELVPKSLEHNVFDMINYVMEGQGERALALYRDLLLQGEETIKLNAILISQFRLLLQVKIMADMGYQQSNMQDVLKIHPYRIKLTMEKVKRNSMSQLGEIYTELVENDFRIKTGQMAKELTFELFLLKYAGLQNLSRH